MSAPALAVPRSAVAGPRARRRPLAVGAALCLALAGCAAPGVPAGEDPDTLGGRWTELNESLDSARSVAVTARWARPAAVVTLAGSLEADRAYRGTSTGAEGAVEAVHADGVTYLRGEGAGDALDGVDPGRWLALPGPAQDLVSPAELIAQVRAELPDTLAPEDAAVEGREVTVDGERLELFSGVRLDGAGPVDLYLDARGRLARVARSADATADATAAPSSRSGAAPTSNASPDPAGALLPRVESVDFDDWDAVPPVVAPPAADVWDRPGL